MSQKIETVDELSPPPAGMAERWIHEIEAAQKHWSKFHKQSSKVVDRYVDERGDSELDQPKKLNLLWSNTETIKPALYNQAPTPEVVRRNKDKDPIGREASEVLERSLAYCLDAYDFDHHMQEAVHDYTLLNFGQVRVEYDPLITGSGAEEKLEAEYAKVSYVHWSDFMTNVARRWNEVRWQAFRHYLTREQLRTLAGKEIGNQVSLDFTPREFEGDERKEALFKKAIAWEIWDKDSRKVIWIAPSYKDAPLAVKDPFCNFSDFFCAPRPLLGVKGKTIIPRSDYVLYQDQAEAIDRLTDKIYTLTEALKVAGAYNGKFEDLQKLVEEGGNTLIPVADWQSFAQGGGMDGNISWMPLKEVAEALRALYEARAAAKQDLYESTGISDIVRGASDPNETATAQQIKNQWGSLRIRDKQKEIQRFARDVMRLKGELISEKFSMETLQQMSGVQLPTMQQLAIQAQQTGQPPNPATPTWEAVYSLLQNDRLRSFSIRIETDSTMEPNEAEEKQSRIEFVTAFGNFLKEATPIMQAAPETGKMLGQVLLFAVRGFKVARELEDTVEQTMEQIEQRAANPQPPQPDPDTKLKVDADLKKHTESLQVDLKKHDDEILLEREKLGAQNSLETRRLSHEEKKIEKFDGNME